MFRKLALTSVVAAAIATLPVATPTASADVKTRNLLAGAAAIAIIGAIAADKERKRHSHTTRRHVPEPVVVQPRKKHRKHVKHRHGRTKGYHAHSGGKRIYQKPRQCLRQKWTERGWVQFYGKNCLRKFGYHRH